jgi:alpha,alpha-trehalose phosphorylase
VAALRKGVRTPKTVINGFYETHPVTYSEEAYGFARTGQTICNVTDAKIIKLFVDDEPLWLLDANILSYDRRLNMKSATLDRDILWETSAGKLVRISSRRLVSFTDRHVAAISYCVTLINARADVVILSEMVAHQPSNRADPNDPRQTRAVGEGRCFSILPAVRLPKGFCCAIRQKGVA